MLEITGAAKPPFGGETGGLQSQKKVCVNVKRRLEEVETGATAWLFGEDRTKKATAGSRNMEKYGHDSDTIWNTDINDDKLFIFISFHLKTRQMERFLKTSGK